MIVGLPVFRVPPSRSGRLPERVLLVVDTGSCPVFTDADTYFGIFLVCTVQKGCQCFRSTSIPTVVTVPGNVIGNEVQITVLAAGGSCRTGRVFLFRQYIQFFDILYRIVPDFLQFIEQAPEADRGMIVVLANQFDELLFAILTEGKLVDKTFIRISSGTDKRNLSPSDDTVPVHQIVHISCLRIVCQADGVDSHLAHQCHIFFMMLGTECVTHFGTILMAAYPMKW